ncbi:MAG: hypothetical protein Q8M34_05640 [Thermodesulfovibrionales bacterium]|nr:hypothetical protein [Thermodesulfovibrionales bacterium]
MACLKIIVGLIGLLSFDLSFASDNIIGKSMCGNALVEIVGIKYHENYETHALQSVTITISRHNKKRVIHFNENNMRGEYFHAACIESKKKHPYIVFQNYCGGSGCRDLDNYGIIDAVSLKTLLLPSDNNRKQASKILGFEAPFLYRDERTFFDKHK